MPVEKAIETIVKILDGLQFLHSRNIIHRDLKPANILLQGETPRLADFGISRAMRTTASSQSSNVSGTFAYMPPEGFDGKRSVQTDVWSVGVNLYQFLTGALPFPQKEPSNLIAAIIMREPDDLPAEIPQGVKNVITKALAKQSENRYASAAEMREDLKKVLVNFSFSQFAPPEILSKEILSESITAPVTIETETATSETEKETVADVNLANYLIPTKPFYVPDSIITQINEKDSVVTQIPAAKDDVRKNSIGMEFVYIPSGDFMMGSTNGDDREKPVHKVIISKGFWMGKTEVTQAQWQAVMSNNPSGFKDCPQCPVENVSWNDAQIFISKLNAQNDGFKYRLPSEAEWEYAARAGTTGDYAGDLDAMAWYYANSDKRTHPVATKQANAWGLYDMHGNVLEWTADWYGSYPSGAITDPTGATSGSLRVRRGSSFESPDDFLRSAYRLTASPSTRLYHLGFRVVRQ